MKVSRFLLLLLFFSRRIQNFELTNIGKCEIVLAFIKHIFPSYTITIMIGTLLRGYFSRRNNCSGAFFAFFFLIIVEGNKIIQRSILVCTSYAEMCKR